MGQNKASGEGHRAPHKVLVGLLLASVLLPGCGRQFLVLNTAGPVAEVEKRLIINFTILVLIVVIPVIGFFT